MAQLIYGLWLHLGSAFKVIVLIMFVVGAAYLLFAALAGCLIDLYFYLRDRDFYLKRGKDDKHH